MCSQGVGTSASYTGDRKIAVNIGGTIYYLIASTTMNRDLERLHDETHDPYVEITRLRQQNLELKMELAQTQARLLQAQLALVERDYNNAKTQLEALTQTGGGSEQDQG
jgi:hypothetical protein